MFVSNLFHPLDHFAWLLFLAYGNMRHGTARRRAVPVFDADRADHDIPGFNFLNRFAPLLGAANSISHNKHLPHRMHMPVGACARVEGYASPA